LKSRRFFAEGGASSRRGIEFGDRQGHRFRVLLSGEPQGGIKIRRRDPEAEFSYARPRDFRSPFGGSFSTW